MRPSLPSNWGSVMVPGPRMSPKLRGDLVKYIMVPRAEKYLSRPYFSEPVTVPQRTARARRYERKRVRAGKRARARARLHGPRLGELHRPHVCPFVEHQGQHGAQDHNPPSVQLLDLSSPFWVTPLHRVRLSSPAGRLLITPDCMPCSLSACFSLPAASSIFGSIFRYLAVILHYTVLATTYLMDPHQVRWIFLSWLAFCKSRFFLRLLLVPAYMPYYLSACFPFPVASSTFCPISGYLAAILYDTVLALVYVIGPR
jgi:hypothetical protein